MTAARRIKTVFFFVNGRAVLDDRDEQIVELQGTSARSRLLLERAIEAQGGRATVECWWQPKPPQARCAAAE
jgi:hypothetical protein